MLRWFGHVERPSGAVRTACDIHIDGRRGKGAQANMEETDGDDCREWKLLTIDSQERSTWRSGVRSAMRAASKFPGRGSTDVDAALAPACLPKI